MMNTSCTRLNDKVEKVHLIVSKHTLAGINPSASVVPKFQCNVCDLHSHNAHITPPPLSPRNTTTHQLLGFPFALGSSGVVRTIFRWRDFVSRWHRYNFQRMIRRRQHHFLFGLIGHFLWRFFVFVVNVSGMELFQMSLPDFSFRYPPLECSGTLL